MSSQCHYMSKDDGPIVKVNLNEWARKRRAGFIFRTEAEFRDQVQGATPDRDDDGDQGPTMDSTKDQIMDYADENGIAYSTNDTKAEILAAIAG